MMKNINDPDPLCNAVARQRVRQVLGGSGKDLHELDYEDVALTSAGMRLVRRAATAVLQQFLSAAGELSLARSLALFLDHVFWDEQSGGLILCADFPGKSYCLPIPRECWALRPLRGRLQ